MTADCVSICNTDNLVNYKMAPLKPGTVQYAIALVSGLSVASDSTKQTFLIDVVEFINTNDVEDYKKVLRKLATLAKNAIFSKTAVKRATWPSSCSPLDAKKVRKLALHPTNASLPDSAPIK